MKFGAEIKGSLKKDMDRELRVARAAAKAAVTRVAVGDKEDKRQVIRAAGLGNRMANTVRSKVYPENAESLRPAGVVSITASYISAFAEGVTINAKGGKWLAIPLVKGYRGSDRITVRDLWFKDVRFIPSKDGKSARLVRRENGVDKVIGILVRQVRISKRLDFAGIDEKWGARLPDVLEKEWENAARREGLL